ncbi:MULTISPECIES: MocR-like pyridoxine biosynthesis transcription factor PdxR [Streptomyces]|uniref:PLP-dependent aminotransferase family protein n=2 Tax=Streptomyces TaxID=1883 RepID=A0ABZ1K5X8_9ACTN|nr:MULTISPECIES: PLP-dependent aminotransferase family protein [Streptomyces]MCY1653254.1 PLP-dependent aminotransferase family protein [Streptomyces sp. SL203]MCY1679509.1 PLP-dependent aminotransferase family protein [Streptomyces sp. SL294]MEE1777833.1 PLP-dependent aminotransferase family protein [Streptomyces sp. JV181]MYT55179.1 aminotransferase class I/II-fold pyridoxal phosphate-dependent enzyme [Streptomyces sp. SID7834]QBR08108.1 PLP-dependent aminotransferase family protein [Strepto
MTDSWAAFGADLHIEPVGAGLRSGLMNALREAVRTGRLTPGTRLPSSRTLASDLGIARNTVADAYAELVAEGWLIARQGSGTRVAQRAAPPGPAARGARPRPVRRRPAHNLMPGSPDLSSFPRAEWLKASRRALAAAPDAAFGYDDPRGRVELRTALADYLARARGVYADPERIVICSGFVHGLTLMGKVLRRHGVRGTAVESYGLDIHWNLLTEAGLRTPGIPVDALGARTGALRETPGVGAVLLTPAHQFPTGVPLHPDRRAEAVDWARSSGGLILEDDYDGEFRYDRQPVGALQGLDPERVVYLGTASKSLAPGLRLAWMVLPEGLVEEVCEAKGGFDWMSGALDQLTLAEFIASGAYDRHVRAMRLRYRRRRDQLVEALAERAPDFRVSGIAAGLHAVLELPGGTEQTVVQAATWQGLALERLSRFRHRDAEPGRDGLVIGYGTPSESGWAGALDALCRVLP